MKRVLIIALAFATMLSLGSSVGGVTAVGMSARSDTGVRGGEKVLPKFVRKWQGDKFQAADLVARGKASVDTQGRVRLPNGTFVDYRLQGTDHIVTVLAEFTDPVHNQIAEPDRSTDNSTYWISDFSRDHYEDMLFSSGGGSYGFPSVADFYRQQSSGRYAVDGQVTEWVQIPQPESYYGENSSEGAGSDNANGPVFRVVRDALQAVADSGNMGDIDWSPSVVDVWDRYDCDGDGNFNEPDGYVDHFQIAHAGEGEEAGGGAQGGDSIWSHRWYANLSIGEEGPDGCLLGGYPLPGTGLWVGDYTIEPENGGVGVFAHEFGHDLGLPDLYDRFGSNDNSVSFWSIMSDGGWPSDDEWSLDTKPVHMGPWEKLVLGWLDGDLATTSLGVDKKFVLGPAEGHTRGAFQAIRVNLPNYSKTTTVFAPEGSDPYYYYSGQGDDLDNSMTRAVGGGGSITFRANYDIETDWDYAYLEASTDGGATFGPIDTSLSTDTSPNGQNFGHGITGTSGGWVDGSATLPTGTTHIRFRYWTDGAVVGKGFAVDSITVGGATDDATDASAWTFDGFRRVTNGEITQTFFHYYLVESRNYLRNDESLRGTYQFLKGNWVEKQPYADGVLIWYRNSGFADNDVSLHPGGGQILVVDSHPAPNVSPDGRGYFRERWQTWDSSFGFYDHTIRLSEYRGAVLLTKPYTAEAVSSFFDSSPTAYYDARIPYNSVKTAGSGLRITLLGVSGDGTTYSVRVHA